MPKNEACHPLSTVSMSDASTTFGHPPIAADKTGTGTQALSFTNCRGNIDRLLEFRHHLIRPT